MLEVFIDHYAQLQDVLSVRDLSGHLISQRLINFEEEEIIQQAVRQSQAASIVLKKIADSLRVGHTISFDKLLMIMEDHGNMACNELANQMRRKLSEKSSGTVTIA